MLIMYMKMCSQNIVDQNALLPDSSFRKANYDNKK